MQIDSISNPLSFEPSRLLKSGEGAGLPIPGSETPEATGANKTFGQMLSDAISDVNKAQVHAGDLAGRYAAGEKMDLHQVMIASQEASVSLSMALQVRNKLLDGYQELLRVNM